MVTALLIATALTTLLVFGLLCVTIELFRDVRQMRDALGILDRPMPIEVDTAAGQTPGGYGLPARLNSERAALVLFLSDKCSTCRVLAATLGGALPAGLWIVVEAPDPEAAKTFVETYGLGAAVAQQRAIIDRGGEIAARLRITTTPAGLRIRNGLVHDAVTVPSFRNLAMLVPAPDGNPVDPARQSTRMIFRWPMEVLQWVPNLGKRTDSQS